MTEQELEKQAQDLEDAQVKAFGDAGSFIANLKIQVANGSPVTQAQLDALGAHLKAMTDTTVAFDIANTEPPVVIPPLPPAASLKR
jgi:hypothetical protein